MKKLTLILAALALCATALTACDSTSESETTGTEAATTAAESTSTTDTDFERVTRPETESESKTEAAPTITYTIKVVDGDGNAVKGVGLQMCTGELCRPVGETDAAGAVTISIADDGAVYQAKISYLPEGYTGDTESYVDFTDNEATITVTKG